MHHGSGAGAACAHVGERSVRSDANASRRSRASGATRGAGPRTGDAAAGAQDQTLAAREAALARTDTATHHTHRRARRTLLNTIENFIKSSPPRVCTPNFLLNLTFQTNAIQFVCLW